jgi:very-short-patch-repair endonuclease
MSSPDRSERTQRARQLRREALPPERALWKHLRKRQIGDLRFRRQHPIGPYFADFCCIEAKLVIEVDGQAHRGDRWERDRARDAFMEREGFRVVRVPAPDIALRLDGVLAMIARIGTERRRALEEQ